VKAALTCPSEYSVLPLDPRSLPPQAVLLWNRVPVQSFRPAEVSRYWFKDPALPLALAPAVRFSFSELRRLLVKVADTSSRRASPSYRVSPSYTYPTHHNGSGPLMGFCSLQHIRDRRSTSRGFAHPLRSAFRVWLPSWRLPPCDPLPVLFHTGSAHGIYPSEVSPPGRYRVRFRTEAPTYR
jgi:hypothetical protein